MSVPKVGVVIGSGGIKSLAVVELFRFLDEEHIPIDLLVGCSGGGILAALRGCGYKPEEIVEFIRRFWNKKLFSEVDYRTLLQILPWLRLNFQKGRALLRPHIIQKTLSEFFGGRRLEELSPPTVLQTTDVDTGEGVVLSKGLVSEALYVTGAQFPFLPPAKIDGRWLTDGGFSPSLPIMEAVKRRMDVIIGLSVEQTSSDCQGFIDFCLHFFARTYTMNVRSQTALAVDLHHHEIIVINVCFDQVINMWNVEKIPQVLEAGKRAIAEKKEDILSAVKHFHGPART